MSGTAAPASYDPEARRDTPLALKLKARIRRNGPLHVSAYMQACMLDAEHGYYKTTPPIGAAGDFVTAPEISQVFGELIGLWCAVVWQQMGSPPAVTLVEFGPGRGTLMHDVLRAIRVVPAFQSAVNVVCVETNPVLEAAQRAKLGGLGYAISWTDHDFDVRGTISRLQMPHILLLNEFLDTLSVDQTQRVAGQWHRRCVGLDPADRLVFVTGEKTFDPPAHLAASANDGDIYERAFPYEMALWQQVKTTPSPPVAALYLDYGHAQSALGETLQAVRKHTFEHPLCSPGEADLSAQVDFEAFADTARLRRLDVDGPITQAEFLGSLGIMQRASRLMAANPGKANEIEMGVARLMAPNGMGTRFKALGVRSRDLPPLPGFPSQPNRGRI